MNRGKAPLFEKVKAHFDKKTSSFHVPGHKSGQWADPQAAAFFRALMAIDYTEISGLDDLHEPTGVIREAEELAADCFGAERTFFLVGGSTVGNLAMIMTLCSPGDILIVQRNAHKSVWHALMLARAKAVFLAPRRDPESGIAASVHIDDVRAALKQFPQAKGLFLTNPNYYGMGIDLQKIVETAHRYHKPVLVDEAHGAHYGHHPRLPDSTLSAGADAVVQSTHKMLTAMTMGAMLHLQGARIDAERLRMRLGMLQSSSPSYPILMSLDLCRRALHEEGQHFFDHGLAVVDRFVRQIAQLKTFRVLGQDIPAANAAYETIDPFKVTVRDETGTLHGYALQRELENDGCMVEMADERHVLLVFSLASRMEDADRLLCSFQRIYDDFRLKKKEICSRITNIDDIPDFDRISPPVSFDFLDQPRRSLHDKEHHDHAVNLEDAVNWRAAEMVIPYPPGIPILVPGEIISPQTVAYIRKLAALGAKFQGARDPSLKTIRILTYQ